MKGSYEELLQKKGFILHYTKGNSMEPMLRQGQEQCVIRSLDLSETEPRVGDVVLFRRGRDYVLHRIVGRKGELFRIRGDNCMGADLVRRDQIVGILSGFYRGDKYVDCTADRSYLRYARRRRLGFPLRWIWGRVCNVIKKVSRMWK